MINLLRVENLTKSFGGLVALRDVSFNVNEGGIVGLVGPNGAGKSTLLNLISGIYDLDYGSIMFDGEDITNTSPYKICRMGVAKTFQLVQSFPEMSAHENVIVGALFGSSDGITLEEAREKASTTLDFVGFAREKFNKPVKNLNVVELRFIQLARALATEPNLLLLDEVSTGLNPSESKKAVSLIEKIRDMGVTILMVEHVMRVIMKLSDKIIVLHHGEKIAEGSPKEIGSNQTVIDAYLGERFI
ncbi:MAG: ABC transporter ATP-binding protein [Candidatus Altiarchaeota archaeon]|nr:ABC transporter ATP-binding protein [Candidatus Altiarchaeota archaeon]